MKTILSKILTVSVLSTAVFASPAFALDNQQIDIHNLGDKTVTIRIKNFYDDKSRTVAAGGKKGMRLGAMQNEYKNYKIFKKDSTGDTLICQFTLSTSDSRRWIEDISSTCQVSFKEDASDGKYIQQKRGYKKDQSSHIDKSLELYWPKQH